MESMDPKWPLSCKMDWIGTLDDIMNVIKAESAQPIGFYIFGISEVRSKALMEVVRALQATVHCVNLYERVDQPDYRCGRDEIVILEIHNHTHPSSEHPERLSPGITRRREAAKALCGFGCKSVIGIYAKPKDRRSLQDDEAYGIAKFLDYDQPQLDQRIDGSNRMITLCYDIPRAPRTQSEAITTV